MKTANLIRAHRHPKFTLGCFTIGIGNHAPLFILEPPWRNNEANISCIPHGEYVCNLVPSSRFNYSKDIRPDIYEVTEILGRSFIRIHPGNRASETNGCLLPGIGVNNDQDWPYLVGSKIALDLIHELINEKTFKLTIR
jgi:hypothetical protein